MLERRPLEAEKVGWHSCRPPYSFYHDFMVDFWEGGPGEALGACMHRLCTLMRKMKAESFVVEDGIGRHDVEEELAHLADRTADIREGWATAAVITFLRTAKRDDDDLSKVPEREFIGQACVIGFTGPKGTRSYVYEAVLRVPGKTSRTQLLNNHISLKCRMSFNARGREVRLPATYFCQQNGITSICAHSSVRMIVRARTGRHASTAELNAIWGFDGASGTVTNAQLQHALNRYGMNVAVFDLSRIPNTFSDNPAENMWGLLAMLADAGSPGLLLFSATEGAYHVVTMLGHTLNTDEWHPLGAVLHEHGTVRTVSNSAWIDHLVIHDDVLGPYYCLSRAALSPASDDTPLAPALAITILPHETVMSAPLADLIGRELMDALIPQLSEQEPREGRWWDFLRKSYERRLLRTTLVDRVTYLDLLLRDVRLDKAQLLNAQRFAAALPEVMWMVELSLPNLFLANRTKLGEILLDATAATSAEDAPEAMRAFRLPSVIGWLSEPGREPTFKTADWPQDGQTPMHAPMRHDNQW